MLAKSKIVHVRACSKRLLHVTRHLGSLHRKLIIRIPPGGRPVQDRRASLLGRARQLRWPTNQRGPGRAPPQLPAPGAAVLLPRARPACIYMAAAALANVLVPWCRPQMPARLTMRMQAWASAVPGPPGISARFYLQLGRWPAMRAMRQTSGLAAHNQIQDTYPAGQVAHSCLSFPTPCWPRVVVPTPCWPHGITWDKSCGCMKLL